jgi:diguanylate cyclase (GGDEF)-like protein
MTPGTITEPWALAFAGIFSAAVFVGNLAVPVGFNLRILYLFPLAMLAIHVARRPALVMANLAILGVIVHSIAVLPMPQHYRIIQCVLAVIAYLSASYLVRLGRQRFMELREVATHDPLTGLNTRSIFRDALGREIARQRRYHAVFSLAIIDLDYFKQLNDTRGHDDGDAALQLVARTMEKFTRAADTLGRIGGDEFALLMPNTDHADCEQVCQLLAERIAQAMREAGYAVSASVGGVTFERSPASDIEAMRAADTAMYQAKARGRGRAVTIGLQPNLASS